MKTTYKIIETISGKTLDKNILTLAKAQESERTLSYSFSRKEEEYNMKIVKEN